MSQLLFGAIAIQEKFVAQEQLDAALAAQRAAPGPRRLGEILVDRGLLTADQVQIILDIQRVAMADRAESPDAGLFGQVATGAGYCTGEEVNAAVRRQHELAASGSRVPLGQLLLRAGHLEAPALADVLHRQDKYPLKCPGCQGWYLVEGLGQGTKIVCRRCLRLVAVPILPGASPSSDLAELVEMEGRGRHPERIRGDDAELLGPFLVEAESGRFTWGVAFRAQHVPSRRLVTLRVFPAMRAGGPAEIERFRQRAAPLLRLSHTRLAAVVDAGQVDGCAYLATEFVVGTPLPALAARRKLPRADLLGVIGEVAEAVAHAHRHGVAHGALKPASVMIVPPMQPRVTDVGVVQLLAAHPALRFESGPVTVYTPPEQIGGRVPDARSDVYALGAMLHEAAGGHVPYPGRSTAQLREQILKGRPQTLPDAVPAALREVCERAMRRSRLDRYATAGEFVEDLHRALAGRPLAPPPRGRLVRAAILAAIAAGAAIAALVLKSLLS